VVIFFILTALLGVSGILPTRAGEQVRWRAWLRYGGHMTLVDSAGTALREAALPLPEGYTLNSRAAVSVSGRWLAYVVEREQARRLMLYDSAAQTLSASYEVNAAIAHSLTMLGAGFNAEETAFALGYQTPDGWQIDIISLVDGQIVHTLKGEPSAPVSIYDYRDAAVHYALNEQGYAWGTLGQSVAPDVIYASPYFDRLESTGEVLAAAWDSRLPQMGPGQPNALHVYDPLLRVRFPVIAVTGYPRFVQNGARILLQTADAWQLLERDGTLVGTLPTDPLFTITSVCGSDIGVLYTLKLNDTGRAVPALFEDDTRDGLHPGWPSWRISGELFQARAGGDADAPLEIVWCETRAAPEVYPPWPQLAAPETAPTIQAPSLSPTLLPTPARLLRAGMTALVQTTGGEILNLRAQPTRESAILLYLENGMRVQLVDGPRVAEGFVWWRVRLDSGLEGWAVENDGALQTLLPG
jgi:hypothetical protein